MTLVELLVGISIALFVTAAAVAFASHETQLMGISKERVSTSQQGRAVLDMIARDLAKAGTGVRFNGPFFGGFLVDRSNASAPKSIVDDQGRFRAGDVALTSAWTTPATAAEGRDVLAITMADGDYATVCGVTASTITYCKPSEDADEEPNLSNIHAVLLSGDGKAMRPVKLVGEAADAACTDQNTECEHGETTVNYEAYSTSYPHVEDSGVGPSNYSGGELAGDVKARVWFVDDQRNLRVATIDNDPAQQACDGGDSCTGTMATNVDFFGVQVLHWDASSNRWVAGLYGLSDTDRRPYRVDVELVLSSGKKADHQTSPVHVAMTDTHIPAGGSDGVERFVFRTTVEIKNSGMK